MSIASFAMFTGGGLGTFLNGAALRAWGFEVIFVFSAVLILIAGALASALMHRMEHTATEPLGAKARSERRFDNAC